MHLKTHQLLSLTDFCHADRTATVTSCKWRLTDFSHSPTSVTQTGQPQQCKWRLIRDFCHVNRTATVTSCKRRLTDFCHANRTATVTLCKWRLTDFCHANRTTSAEATAAQHTGRTAVWPETGHHGTDVGRTGRLAHVEAVHTRHHHQNDDGHNDNTANERHDDSAGSEVKNTTKESCV